MIDGNFSQKAYEIVNYYKTRKLVESGFVTYNEKFLLYYRPNIFNYFSKIELKDLENMGNIYIKNKNINEINQIQKKILESFLIDLSWASSKLEGNTYNLLDTQNLILYGIENKNKTNEETTMILNHKKAIQYLLECKNNYFNETDVKNIHYLLGKGLLDNDDLGVIRRKKVKITNSNYIPLEYSMDIYPNFDTILNKLNEIEHPIEQSFFALIHISYLQPFIDFNKRTSRLMANLSLLKNNLSPISFINMSQDFYISGLLEIYEKNDISLMKEVFKNAYKFSCEKYLKYLNNDVNDINKLNSNDIKRNKNDPNP